MLSVVIITCNRKESLLITIDSCVKHVDMLWELVVVDNGSTDGTENCIKEYCSQNNIDLQYYYSGKNLGVAGARNIGYELAKGDILYFIDDDAYIISEGNSLDQAYKYLSEQKDIQILSGKIIDALWGGVLPEITANKKPMEDGVELRSFIGCSHFIKKNELLSSTLYPGNLFYGGEEIYLSYLVHLKNKKIVYYENLCVQHNPSKNTRASKYEIYRNRILNWYIVKQYFYPFPYITLSTVVYWYRILKLTKFDAKRLKEIREIHKERYAKRYKNKFTIRQMHKLNIKFSFRYLV